MDDGGEMGKSINHQFAQTMLCKYTGRALEKKRQKTPSWL